MWDNGLEDYADDWWNIMDFIMNSLYLATIALKIVSYAKMKVSYVGTSIYQSFPCLEAES